MRTRPPKPDAWPPEKLFRLFLRPGGPRLALPPMSFAPRVRLWARGLTSREEYAIRDDGEEMLDRVVAAATVDRNGPAFASPDHLGALLLTDFEELASAVTEALDVVSPAYIRVDVTAWRETLTEGARHVSNHADVWTIGGAYDWTGGGEQPDRYFGVPLCNLTDGQLMAYRAALSVVSDRRKATPT